MRRRKHRHPALETAVFAAALLLAAFIGRELWLRRPAARPVPAAASVQALALDVSFPPSPRAETARRTETAVTGVAPIKLTRVARPKPGTKTVPAPR